MNYCYGKGVQKCVFSWEVVPFSEVYRRFHCIIIVATSKSLQYYCYVVGTFKVVVSNKYEAQTRYRILVEKLKEFKRKYVQLVCM